jgi:thiol-disulfide isomerase/thioredoxin
VAALWLVTGTRAAAGAPALLPRDLALVDLEGRTWTRDALAGRVVALDFWATWCAPCVRERSRWAALRAAHPERDLVILSVNLDHADRRSLVAWLNRRRIGWPQVHEPLGGAGTLPLAFGVRSLPWTVVYGRDGRLLWSGGEAGGLEELLASQPRARDASPIFIP